MTSTDLYIGLMSGTSADAIDAVLVDLTDKPCLIDALSRPISSELRQRIHRLCLPGDDEIDRMGQLDVELGLAFAQTANQLVERSGLRRELVRAIGSHGQTIRHRPHLETSAQGFTLQIGDPNIIAEKTGITTIADFRRRDMAAGGQGAPLVPAFHQAVFSSCEAPRVIVNIGGMANLTFLPTSGDVVGFDTGPGNVLLDSWILAHRNKNFDANGAWAMSGKPHPLLLGELMAHPFFAQPHPKSTGRESFNLQWLRETLTRLNQGIAAEDVQATLLELTALTIGNDIKRLCAFADVIVCGGGAYNGALLNRLQTALPGCKVVTTEASGISPLWVEAMAFAWLARQTLNRRHGNLKSVTGAKKDVILGGIYLAG